MDRDALGPRRKTYKESVRRYLSPRRLLMFWVTYDRAQHGLYYGLLIDHLSRDIQ
jgi:hypothetical protein